MGREQLLHGKKRQRRFRIEEERETTREKTAMKRAAIETTLHQKQVILQGLKEGLNKEQIATKYAIPIQKIDAWIGKLQKEGY